MASTHCRKMQTQSWMTKQGPTMCSFQEKHVTRKGTEILNSKGGKQAT